MKEQEGMKFDAGKLRYDLMPVCADREVVKILTFGAAKYADDNWRKVDNQKKRYYAAARRHIEAWRGNEMLDVESGYHHLAHAICCLIFLMTPELENMEVIND